MTNSSNIEDPLTVEKRFQRSIRVMSIGILAGVCFSYPLWFSHRAFPTSPVLDNLQTLPFVVQISLYLLLLACPLTLIRRPSSQLAPLLFVICSAVLICFDQARLQPWFYQYVLMNLVLFLSLPKRNSKEEVLNTYRLVLFAVYLWSGLQKINLAFIKNGFPWMIGPLVKPLGEDASILYLLGYLAPELETIFALGLLFKFSRKYSVVLLSLMHLFILTALGPLGHNWNFVVWPWNVVMMNLLYLLFWNTDFSAADFLKPLKHAGHSIVFVLLLIMPAFSFIGLWDQYLSFALYAPTHRAVANFDAASISKLPSKARESLVELDDGSYKLPYLEWSMSETNVPVYPARRVLERISEFVCKNYKPKKITLLLTPPINERQMREEAFACEET